MPRKPSSTKKTTKKPAKNKSSGDFKRKVTKTRPLAATAKITPREAVMAVVYRTLKTAPLNLLDIEDIGGFRMTEKRAEMCERYFADFMDKMCVRFEKQLLKKGHDDLIEKLVPPRPYAAEYEEVEEDADED